MSSGMALQRCFLHGRRDFSFLLYADGVKGRVQKPFRALLDQNPLFHFRQADLEMINPKYAPVVRKRIRKIRLGFAQLQAVLPADKYPRTKAYVENFARQALVFFDYWLDHQCWLPLTTNINRIGV